MQEFKEDPTGIRAADSADVLAIPVDRVEIERLRAMLREQEQATLRAVETAADLQSKLSSNNARKADEIATLQSRWHLAQRELETQRRERRIEAVRAAAKVSTLQREIESRAVEVEPATGPPPDGKDQKIRRTAITIVGVAALAALTTIGWRVIAAQSWQSPNASAPAAETYVSQNVTVTDAALALPADSPAAFSMAVNRLDEALASIPGRTPEDILQQASKNRKVCKLQWNGGHPSLLFDGEPSHANSLSATIDQCADAVRHLH
jgi:hypothetical protein